MVYANPNGHDWGNNYNWDGLGVSYVAFGATYSLIFYAMCAIVWANRKHPVLKMRNIGLAISALLVLHVYLFLIFVAYALNGQYPCDVEFWIMSFYLPMGVGLFQAQNQQLLLVSRAQAKLVYMDDTFKPLAPARLGPKRWNFKLRQWWAQWTEQSKYEGFVAVGMVLQLVVSTVIFLISRKFTGVGFVSHPVSKGMCRRGWEWLPGSPMWLISAYADNFAPVNKYWIPAAWFVPGLITMEMVTLGFPIYQVYHHKRAVYKTTQAIAKWEATKDLTLTGASSVITGSSKGRSANDLEECLRNDFSQFFFYACSKELAGENVKFLLKVIGLKKQWDIISFQAGEHVDRARMAMYRAALDIYISMVYDPTAIQPINVEWSVYQQLGVLFNAAAQIVASDRPPTPNSARSVVAPWDEPLIDQSNDRNERQQMANLTARGSCDASSTQPIINFNEPVDPNDKLIGFNIPVEFGKDCFDDAYGSIKHMVWTGTWAHWVALSKDLDQH